MGYFEEFIGVNFWTALFTLLNFLVVLFVGRKYLYGPLTRVIQDRQAEIDHMYDAAGKAREDAKALETQYRQKLSDAQATSQRLVKEAVVRGKTREEEIIRRANAEAAAIMDKAAAQITREKKKAIHDARDQISGLALAIAAKVVGRQLTDADQSALVDQFIDRLGDEA